MPSEIIDILKGRISSSIFLKFYYKPFLKEIRGKVMNDRTIGKRIAMSFSMTETPITLYYFFIFLNVKSL